MPRITGQPNWRLTGTRYHARLKTGRQFQTVLIGGSQVAYIGQGIERCGLDTRGQGPLETQHTTGGKQACTGKPHLQEVASIDTLSSLEWLHGFSLHPTLLQNFDREQELKNHFVRVEKFFLLHFPGMTAVQ